MEKLKDMESTSRILLHLYPLPLEGEGGVRGSSPRQVSNSLILRKKGIWRPCKGGGILLESGGSMISSGELTWCVGY